MGIVRRSILQHFGKDRRVLGWRKTLSRHSILLAQLSLHGVARRAVAAEATPFQILVNNAGTNRPAYLADVKVEDFDAIFALNVRAAFFIAQAVQCRRKGAEAFAEKWCEARRLSRPPCAAEMDDPVRIQMSENMKLLARPRATMAWNFSATTVSGAKSPSSATLSKVLCKTRFTTPRSRSLDG